MLTLTTLDRIAPQMIRNARELAHSNLAVAQPTDADAAAFGPAYVAAVAETCGAEAASTCPDGEPWAPIDWPKGDSDAVIEAAALVGETLTPSRWLELFALYSAPSESARRVCGL